MNNPILYTYCNPEKKDIKRAQDMKKIRGKVVDYEVPVYTNATKMAKLIKDPAKLVRRTKAVVAVWGTGDITGMRRGREVTINMFEPFARRMEELGFSWSQIRRVEKYEHPDALEAFSVDVAELFI